MLKQATKEAVLLILVATGIALAVYALRSDKISLTPAGPRPGEAQATNEDVGYREISLHDARQYFDDQSALFADARHAADFAAGHIAGALNLSLADQDRWLPDLLASTPPTTVIITYCDGERCHLATQLAEFLFFNGFDQVYYLRNGWTRWRESGFPAE